QAVEEELARAGHVLEERVDPHAEALGEGAVGEAALGAQARVDGGAWPRGERFVAALDGLAQQRVGLDRVDRLLVVRLRGLVSAAFAGRTPDGVDREVVRDAPGEAQQAIRSAVR